jgi:HEPN domain-containing protein
MDDARLTEVLQWLKKSENDLGSAKLLVSTEPPFLDTSVYHCQQAAEKSLKSYLTYQEIPFYKIHDLRVLVNQCQGIDETFIDLLDAAEILTPYSTAFRYPGSLLEPEISDVEEAIHEAQYIFDFILSKLPEDIKNKLK